MDYGNVLTRAWQIIWKHKVLWIFGILAGLGGQFSQGGRDTSYRFSQGTRYPTNNPNIQLPPAFQRFAEWLQSLPKEVVALYIGLLLLFIFFLIILFTFLGTIGRIGLVRGAIQADQGSEHLAFGELFNGSLRYFWRVFFMNLLIALAIFVIGALMVVIFLILVIGSLGILLICLLPALCILAIIGIPLGWFINVWVEQANIALVVEDLSIQASLQRGWGMVRNNLGEMILMGIILLLVGFIGGLVIGAPVLIIIGPVIAGMVAGGVTGNIGWFGGGIAVTLLCLVFYIPVAIVLGGILRSYIGTAWTLTFLRLKAKVASFSVVPPASPAP